MKLADLIETLTAYNLKNWGVVKVQAGDGKAIRAYDGQLCRIPKELLERDMTSIIVFHGRKNVLWRIKVR